MGRVLEVKLVESDSALHSVIAVLGPILVLLAAIAAAAIAARTAGKRQKRQLEHDRSVFYGQLAHDRRMRYEAHLRDVFDAAFERVNSAVHASGAFRRATIRLEALRDERDQLEEDGAEGQDLKPLKAKLKRAYGHFVKAGQVLDGRLAEITSDSARLRLRLGDDSMVDQHTKLHESWEELARSLKMAKERNRTEDQIQEEERIFSETGEAFSELMVSLEEWFVDQGSGERF
jgi:hypothetical protein